MAETGGRWEGLPWLWRSRALAGSSRGFSLAEVLVVGSILVVGLLGAASLYPVSQTQIYQAADVARATAIAKQQLEMIKNKGTLDGTVSLTDCPTLPTAVPGFTVSCFQRPGSPDIPPPTISAVVRIVVSWTRPPTGSVTMSAVVLRPDQ